MRVKYSAVNGVGEVEVVKSLTSCVTVQEENMEHLSENNAAPTGGHICGETGFGGKENLEQTTFKTHGDKDSKENCDEIEEEPDVDSVFEDEISHNHIRQRHKESVQGQGHTNARSRTQEVLHTFPVKSTCCCRHVSESQSEGWCSLKTIPTCHSGTDTVDLDTLYEEEPFRKRAQRACFTFVYIILAAVAVLATYSMVNDLVVSVRNPVRSVHYKVTNEYRAPGKLAEDFSLYL